MLIGLGGAGGFACVRTAEREFFSNLSSPLFLQARTAQESESRQPQSEDREGRRFRRRCVWRRVGLDFEDHVVEVAISFSSVPAAAVFESDEESLRVLRALEEREVLVQRLNQTEPGQLGRISRRMADAGVNIEVLYSDHDHQLILVVDDIERGRTVSEAWARDRA